MAGRTGLEGRERAPGPSRIRPLGFAPCPRQGCADVALSQPLHPRCVRSAGRSAPFPEPLSFPRSQYATDRQPLQIFQNVLTPFYLFRDPRLCRWMRKELDFPDLARGMCWVVADGIGKVRQRKTGGYYVCFGRHGAIWSMPNPAGGRGIAFTRELAERVLVISSREHRRGPNTEGRPLALARKGHVTINSFYHAPRVGSNTNERALPLGV